MTIGLTIFLALALFATILGLGFKAYAWMIITSFRERQRKRWCAVRALDDQVNSLDRAVRSLAGLTELLTSLITSGGNLAETVTAQRGARSAVANHALEQLRSLLVMLGQRTLEVRVDSAHLKCGAALSRVRTSRWSPFSSLQEKVLIASAQDSLKRADAALAEAGRQLGAFGGTGVELNAACFRGMHSPAGKM